MNLPLLISCVPALCSASVPPVLPAPPPLSPRIDAGAAQAAASPGASAGDVQARLERAVRRLRAELSDWRAAFRDAPDDELREALRAEFPMPGFVEELGALAREAGPGEVASAAWFELFRAALATEERATFERAVEELLRSPDSPYAAAFALDLTWGAPAWTRPRAQSALRQLLAQARNVTVRSTALAQLALCVGLDPDLGEAGRAEALALLETIEREFGAQPFLGQSGAEFAASARFEIEHLRVGATAPDFELADIDGARFHLTDYRGQVVLLDFWGYV